MGPDPRIADFITAHRGRLTRKAITQQLRDAGYEQEAIDATWAVLDTPDPDDQVGDSFWGRFWIYLIGLNAAAFLVVGLATQIVPNETGLAAVLGVALAIGGVIALGLVAMIHPTRLRRSGAIAIGAVIPLIFAFLIAGSCYALIGIMGGPSPPPLAGTLTLHVDPPVSVEATGQASCQPSADGSDFYSVFTDAPMGAGQISVFVSAYAVVDGGEAVPSVSILFGDPEQVGVTSFEYQPGSGPSAGIEMEPGSNATAGSATFEGFLPVEAFDEQGRPIDRFDADPISGTISWSCES
jgi:hypothetical protein